MKSLTKPLSQATLRDVARDAGLSLSAVSYALRGASNIPASTVERVRAVAERLRYRSNPRVGELMAHIRRSRPVARGERLAFIWLDAPWKKRPFTYYLTGTSQRAEELGYGIEEFWLDEPGMSHIRLADILRSRGIAGLVLSPLSRSTRFQIEWDWDLFSPALLGNAGCTPELHRAGHHHFLGMKLAMDKLVSEGYRRIATILDPEVNERAKRAWSASFLEHHPDPNRSRRFLFWEAARGKTAILSRLKTVRADAVVCGTSTATLLCPSGAVRCGGRRVAVLDRVPHDTRWSGISQCEDILGAQAVDLVAGQLYNNERGVPTYPKMLLFPGHWVEVQSAPTQIRSAKESLPANSLKD